MMKIIAAALLCLPVVLVGVPGVLAPATAQAAYGWHYAGAYHCEELACRKADQLEAYGYATCIKRQSGCWCVYYK